MVVTFVAVGIGYAVTEAHNRGEHWWQYIMRLPAALLLLAALSLCAITFPLWSGGFLGDFRPDVQFLLPLLMLPRILCTDWAAPCVFLVIWEP